MNRTYLATLAAICLLGASAWSRASFISLQTSASLTISNREAGVVLRITNLGDEPAKGVQVETRFDTHASLSKAKDALAASETMQIVQPLGEVPDEPGVFPVILKTYYTDANGYPFSALSVLSLANGSSQPELLSAGAAPISMNKEGVLSLVLRTATAGSLDTRVRLVLPDEIGCEAPETNLIIQPGQSRVADFRLKNLSARPGSTYPVFAVAEYEQAGEHHAVIATVSIGIEQRHAILRNPRMWTLVAAGLLCIFFVVQVVDRLRAPAKRA